MSRTARVKSETGIYHVMLRGLDKRDIFLQNGDFEVFLKYIAKAKEKSNISVLAYCLMTNHVHLLLKEGNEALGNTMKRIAVGYVQYFNFNNGRVGHLYQNRFQSEPINDDNYLLAVLRYIHQNPLKAGIVKEITDYRWSSFNDYVNDKAGLVDKELVMGYFKDQKSFVDFNNKENDQTCIEYSSSGRINDAELKKLIHEILDIETLPNLDIKTRNEVLHRIKQDIGASDRQLERVLGIGRGIIHRA